MFWTGNETPALSSLILQRPGPETFDSFQSAGAQLTQTAHFALQLPYTIFGLGMAPNFVDYLWVNISGKTHAWPQIMIDMLGDPAILAIGAGDGKIQGEVCGQGLR